MKGKIIKRIAGLYYVHAGMFSIAWTESMNAKAKGKSSVRTTENPLVGTCKMDIIDEAQKKGKYHYGLLPRHSAN